MKCTRDSKYTNDVRSYHWGKWNDYATEKATRLSQMQLNEQSQIHILSIIFSLSLLGQATRIQACTSYHRPRPSTLLLYCLMLTCGYTEISLMSYVESASPRRSAVARSLQVSIMFKSRSSIRSRRSDTRSMRMAILFIREIKPFSVESHQI